MRRLLWGFLLIGFCAGNALAQTLTADEIVARVNARDAERQTALVRYGSDRTYRVTYKGPMGDRSAEVQARMDFSAPDQKHFTVLSETGSEMFCHKVLRKMMEAEQEGALQANHLKTMLSSDNYNLKLVGEEDTDGVKSWILQVSPKVNSRFTYKGKVWVSKDDYAVVRIVGSPAKNPSWISSNATFDYRYARKGGFWLPESNTTVSHVRTGGQVTLTVDYGTYDIVPAERRVAEAMAKPSPVAVAAVVNVSAQR
jgi:hypothetical protein